MSRNMKLRPAQQKPESLLGARSNARLVTPRPCPAPESEYTSHASGRCRIRTRVSSPSVRPYTHLATIRLRWPFRAQALWVLHGFPVLGWWVGERKQQGRAPLRRCACVGIARRQGDACSGAGWVWCRDPPVALCATLPSHLGAGRAGVNRARGSIMRAWARGGAPRPSRWSDHLADRDRLPDRLRSRCWCAPWPTACRSRCRGRGTGSRHVGRRKDAKPPPPRLLRLPPMVAEAEAER